MSERVATNLPELFVLYRVDVAPCGAGDSDWRMTDIGGIVCHTLSDSIAVVCGFDLCTAHADATASAYHDGVIDSVRRFRDVCASLPCVVCDEAYRSALCTALTAAFGRNMRDEADGLRTWLGSHAAIGDFVSRSVLHAVRSNGRYAPARDGQAFASDACRRTLAVLQASRQGFV